MYAVGKLYQGHLLYWMLFAISISNNSILPNLESYLIQEFGVGYRHKWSDTILIVHNIS